MPQRTPPALRSDETRHQRPATRHASRRYHLIDGGQIGQILDRSDRRHSRRHRSRRH